MTEESRDRRLAEIRAGAWWVRHYSRPTEADRARRARKIRELAAAAVLALQLTPDPEAVLYELAVGLYDRRDPRFVP